MAVKMKLNEKSLSMPAGIGLGVLLSFVIVLIGAGVLAYFISNESIGEDSIGAGCTVILLLSSAVGALLAAGLTKRQRLITCGITVLCNFLMLLGMTAMFFGGQYDRVGVTALAVLGGGIVSVMPAFLKGKTGRKPVKIKGFR